MNNTHSAENHWDKTMLVLLALLIITATGFGLSIYKYLSVKKELAYASSTEGQREAAKKETQALIDKVKKLIVLPEGEDPVVATIVDKDLLAKEQPFYENAHNGDRVIAYMNARKAIIYDPINDKIVNAGPIYIQNGAAGSTTSK